MKKNKIAIAGASGFVGQNLTSAILKNTDHNLVCLSRSIRTYDSPRVESRTCDFYSMGDSENALEGCDQAIYLMHSMSVYNRLSQGSFIDFDYLLADNFARAAKKAGIKNIIYIGGMGNDEKENLSEHLTSRIEMERVLASRGTPVTVLRCSMIIGPQGSSFLVLKRLVERLPVMGLPKWIKTQSQPIYIKDVIKIILNLLDSDKHWGRTYDCGSPQVCDYKDIIRYIAESLSLKRVLVDLPAIPIEVSRLWVSVISRADSKLVYPLIDSVDTPMILGNKRRLPKAMEPDYTAIGDAVDESIHRFALANEQGRGKPGASVKSRKEVRSIQTLIVPKGYNAYHLARLFVFWLPRFLTHFLRVKRDRDNVDFHFSVLPISLLNLELIKDKSNEERQLFKISGGILTKQNDQGRFEFRIAKTRNMAIAAVHDYQPALPWWIYRSSQALVHKWVMKEFNKFLTRLDEKIRSREAQ